MNLSKNFPLKEMIESETAMEQNINNEPNAIEKQFLFYLCQFLLQPIRNHFGRIDVSSGFRCSELNRAVGGSMTSQHRWGEAADIIPRKANKMDVYSWIIDNLNFGQIIIYDDLPGIIHLSMPRLHKPNGEILIRRNGKYKPYIKGSQI